MSYNTKVSIAGVEFKNPIIAASGTYNFGKEFEEFYPLNALGGISAKGLTLQPRSGNQAPRVAETPCGMLNSVGLQNPGVDKFLREDLPELKKKHTVIIANIAGNSVDDYKEIAGRVAKSEVDMIELNISCPNVKEGGIAFGVNPKSVYDITKEVKKQTNQKPLIVKLTPNVANIADNAKAAEDGGAEAISLINTVGGMAVDYKTRRPILANICGGLSGRAVKPIALKMVWQCYNAVKIPIIGMGGIFTYTDVLEFVLCGASAVQIGTANLIDPLAAFNIAKDLDKYLRENDQDIRELVGALKV